jgi:multiple sugar transport system substrate-binding protein
LSLCSIAVSLGADPAADEQFLPANVFDEAVELLREFAARAPDGTAELNPIGLLDRMSSVGDIHYIPLIFGYAPYSMRTGDSRVAFGMPPSASGGIGATLGGTGIAVTRRCSPSPALLEHISWLMSDEAQRRVIPAHEGQPSARSAWTDTRVDEAAGGFYSATLDALEHSWVRPRFAGYVPVQTDASRLIRQAIDGSLAVRAAHDRVAAAFTRARASATTGASA